MKQRGNDWIEDVEVYETVGPALPERPSENTVPIYAISYPQNKNQSKIKRKDRTFITLKE